MTHAVRAGIIGAGFISDYHIKGLQGAGANVVRVCSRTRDRARRKAREFGIAGSGDSVEELVNRDDVDLVVIATPDDTHHRLAIQSAAAGKAILLQKPMARTSAEAEEIVAAAEHARVPLIVSFMHRYFDEVIELRKLLRAGVLGDVSMIRQRNATPGADWADWFYRADASGGVVMQLGIHGIDLIRYLFAEIDAVQASVATTATTRTLADSSVVTPENEDLAIALYRLGSGAIAVHDMSYREVAGTDRFRMEIYGDAGTAWLRTERGLLSIGVQNSDGNVVWESPVLPESPPGVAHHEHVLAMIRGDEPVDASARDGVASLRVAEAVYQAAATNHWTTVRRP